MRFIAMMGLGFCVFVTGLTLPTTDANAVVCARGFYRAGCVGPHGAVGVRRGYYHGGVRLFIADITIGAWSFAVAVGELDAGTRASISRRTRHDRATEVSLTYHGARPRHRP